MNASRAAGDRAGLRLSVIVPVYNERYLVGELIRRVLAVSVPGVARIDLVVVDDASTDGSGEILAAIAAAEPARVRLLRHPRNQGKGAAIRTGIREAGGDLIVFQDADLEYDPGDYPHLVRPFLETAPTSSTAPGSSPRGAAACSTSGTLSATG